MAATSNRYESLPVEDTLESPIVTDSLKRKNLPSSSSEDQSPVCKRVFAIDNFDDSSLSDKMEDKENLSVVEDIKFIKGILNTLATSESIQKLKDELHEQMKNEIDRVCQSFDKGFVDFKKEVQTKLDHFESRVFDVEKKIDTVLKENNNLRTENEHLKDRLFVVERGLNDSEQYGRRWNLRVFNVEEKPNETIKDVTEKVCAIFSDDVKVKTDASMIEACHRTGDLSKAKHEKKCRPIIVRFKFRGQRDDILKNRKNLAGKGVTISEDVTRYTADICKAAYKHKDVYASWTTNGKVLVKLGREEKPLRVPYGCDLNRFLADAVKNKPGQPSQSENMEADG